MPPEVQQKWFDFMLERGIIQRVLEKEKNGDYENDERFSTNNSNNNNLRSNDAVRFWGVYHYNIVRRNNDDDRELLRK